MNELTMVGIMLELFSSDVLEILQKVFCLPSIRLIFCIQS